MLTGKNILILPFVMSFWQITVLAHEMNLQQVLQKVVNHYPSIKSAAFQVAKARQENIKVESQLSWILQGNAGYNRNTSLFGTATDRYNLGGGVNRRLNSGDELAFNATVDRENASDTFGPTIPNPLTKTRFDINYRHRLKKGADNPLYQEGLASAEAGEKLAISDKLDLYDQLASQVVDLYLGVAGTQARINSIDKTIERTERLRKYIQKELKLGLSEEKDILQVNARLSINEADKKSLQVVHQKQLISLNRLMGATWSDQLIPEIDLKHAQKETFKPVYLQSQQHSPALKRIDARLKLADSDIRSRRDAKKDQLDLVMFVGNEFNQGELSVGQLSESEIIGGIRVEFNRGLDKSGFDAQLRQAHYDRDIALQDKKQILEDLQYDILSLLAEIKASQQALSAFEESTQAEKKKLDEATQRYRDGRIETDRLIDFESQLAVAELSLDLQKIELVRRYHQLDLVRGMVWKDIQLPIFTINQYDFSQRAKRVDGGGQ